MRKVDGILTIRDGRARVWNRPDRVSQSEMRRLLSVLRAVPGLDAYELPPDEETFARPRGRDARPNHAELMSRHPSRPRTYSVVPEASGLV